MTAMVGVGMSRHCTVTDAHADESAAAAPVAALDDAGPSVGDGDGLFSSSAVYFMPTLTFGGQFGIRPRYTDSTSVGGSSFITPVKHAAAALEAGLCNVALVAHGFTQRSSGGRLRSMSEYHPLDEVAGYRYPVSGYALAAARHMREHGTTSEQLAEVAVAARRWGQRTPVRSCRSP